MLAGRGRKREMRGSGLRGSQRFSLKITPNNNYLGTKCHTTDWNSNNYTAKIQTIRTEVNLRWILCGPSFSWQGVFRVVIVSTSPNGRKQTASNIVDVMANICLIIISVCWYRCLVRRFNVFAIRNSGISFKFVCKQMWQHSVSIIAYAAEPAI